jgi:hypothetical protein
MIWHSVHNVEVETELHACGIPLRLSYDRTRSTNVRPKAGEIVFGPKNLVDTHVEPNVHNVDKYLNDIAFAAVEALMSPQNFQVWKECIELLTLQCERLRELAPARKPLRHMNRARVLAFD